MKFIKNNGLVAICAVSMMIIGGVAVPGEARADDVSEQTISGDSGSVDTAIAMATVTASEAPEKAMTERERRRAEKKAEKARRKAEKQAAKEQKAQEKTKNKNKKKKSPLICKREKVSGSHMRKKVCRTQEEIDAQREADQRSIRDINPAGGITPG